MPEPALSKTFDATPTLSPDQKAQILLLQRQILSTQVNINNLTKQLEQMGPSLNQLLTNIAKELDINPNFYTFDLEHLKLIPNISPKES